MISKKEYLEMTNEISYLKSRIILLEYNIKEEIKEFLDDLNKINKIVTGGCPKINVITEIFGMKKKYEARRK